MLSLSVKVRVEEVLCLDKEDGRVRTVSLADDVVGGSAVEMSGLVGYDEIWQEFCKKLLQGRPVGVFACQTSGELFIHGLNVFIDVHYSVLLSEGDL